MKTPRDLIAIEVRFLDTVAGGQKRVWSEEPDTVDTTTLLAMARTCPKYIGDAHKETGWPGDKWRVPRNSIMKCVQDATGTTGSGLGGTMLIDSSAPSRRPGSE